MPMSYGCSKERRVPSGQSSKERNHAPEEKMSPSSFLGRAKRRLHLRDWGNFIHISSSTFNQNPFSAWYWWTKAKLDIPRDFLFWKTKMLKITDAMELRSIKKVLDVLRSARRNDATSKEKKRKKKKKKMAADRRWRWRRGTPLMRTTLSSWRPAMIISCLRRHSIVSGGGRPDGVIISWSMAA